MSTSSVFPGFDHLYSLGSTGSTREFIADIEFGDADPLAVTCGEQKPTKVTARWAMGSAIPGEVVWTRFVIPVLLSARVVTALQDARCSGWSVYPVKLKGKKGESLPDYYGLVVHGRCGPIDYNQSKKVDKIYPGGVFPVWKGLYFDPATWDGSDLFMAAGAGFKFVVTAVKRAFENAKVENVQFTALDEVKLESVEL